MPRLIDAYKVRIDRDDFDTYSDYITALDAVTQAPTVSIEPPWIPCRVGLPGKTDLYYVTIRDKNGTEYTSCMCYYRNLARWEVNVNVIAWMPGPEPYKEEE